MKKVNKNSFKPTWMMKQANAKSKIEKKNKKQQKFPS